MQPIRVIDLGDSAIEAVVALSDMGKYVSVDVAEHEHRQVAPTSDDEEDDGTGVRLYQSIYETALRNQIPRPVIEDLIRIYSYDVDFQRKAQPGDSFEVLYRRRGRNAGGDSKNDVLFAALTVGGEIKKFYRFQTADDGIVDYYDETGKSAKKFLVRKPVADGIMRSGFGARNHPLLGYYEDAHRRRLGARRSARRSTPPATARSTKIGWEGGYGKYIRIRHANGYETAYGHMTAFARGIDAGTRVRQGQVIGYRRLDRPVDRRARALRDPGQRPLRRSRCASSCRAAACSTARCWRASTRTRPARRHDDARRITGAARGAIHRPALTREPWPFAPTSFAAPIAVYSSRLWAVRSLPTRRRRSFATRWPPMHAGISLVKIGFWLTPWVRSDEHLPMSHVAEVTHDARVDLGPDQRRKQRRPQSARDPRFAESGRARLRRPGAGCR